MSQLLGHSITYRIAVGPPQGRKVFTLQTLPACDPDDLFPDTVGKVARFSRTTHVIFEPLDFVARLAALVPKPRVNLTRYHGVFAPNSSHRARVTPAKRGKGSQLRESDESLEQTPA